ncbi:nuclear protein localization protein 4 [Apophysomyces sp. BC1034]|nr:nuclear protein localization protein 4 [Apophysomyces sp. BC1015]KAG0183631.1 nuclear protein localization protein 4 [Apophysomyces sp. BC1021]KAG0194889.1 nuclear protein localization protein 4 [Apophysomyces sp. BC1034]
MRLLRIRSKEGMNRVAVEPEETFASLAEKITVMLGIADPSTIALGDQPNPSAATSITQIADKTLASANLKHGDIVFVSYVEPTVETTESHGPRKDTAGYIAIDDLPTIKQDKVDDFLEKQRGLIKRAKDPKFCRHGDNAMCDYCMPLEPYDQDYLEENKIKHMSFHAYMRKIDAAQQTKAPSSAILKKLPPLEEPNYKVKAPCTGGHAPWPEGICTKCQPSAITLQRQTYRMVDHIEFSSASLIDNFLNYWRESGCQRFGYLYGRYEPYLDVPLGIKAVVEAIYEPPQDDHMDGIQMNMPWQDEAIVNEVAEACGLVQVGMVYTDLIDDGSGSGTVVSKRHVDSYFLSSLECSFSAEMQRRHPNSSRHSLTGKYGSKFVTCVISGDVEGNIDVKAYQVSETMVAMQDAGIVESSRKPSVIRVKESIPHERYVPEVFYKYKNKYNVVVKESAKPTFPVEYLLVNVTNGFPHNPSPLFDTPQGYTVENRASVVHQDMGTLSRHLTQAKSPVELKKLLADFHLLCFIRSTDILSATEFKQLCETATKAENSVEVLESMDGWKTLMIVLKEAGE